MQRAILHGGRLAFVVVLGISAVMLFSPASAVPGGLNLNDKVVHFLLFAALAGTGVLAGVPVVPLGLGALVYAGVSEVLQAVLPIDRNGDWRDFLADAAGVLSGLFVVMAALHRARA